MAVSFAPKETPYVPEVTLTNEKYASNESVECIHPLQDHRWDRFVAQHPRSSIFHTSAWLETLHRTYGFEPVAFTNSSTDSLDNALLFCRVDSWLTGRRLVSLPFSDHCEPLLKADELTQILAYVISDELRDRRCRYVEMRPLSKIETRIHTDQSSIKYTFHELDLKPNLDQLFGNFHKSSIQRKIRRAERERLRYCEGSNPELLADFYGLFEQTRRRHRIPPQPRQWFENLTRNFGSSLKVRVAYHESHPVAAMITIGHRDTLVYKYGCSDSRVNNLGGVHMLFWRAIQDAKSAGLETFDFGRTDADQQGLITFKSRWGAKQLPLTYSRFGNNPTHLFDLSQSNVKDRVMKSVISWLPRRLVSKIGASLYGHVG